MRKEVPEIGWGDFKMLRAGGPEVLAMRYDWRNNSVVVLHNLSSAPQEVRVEVGLQGDDGTRLVNLLSGEHSVADESGRHRILMEGYGYRWYRAGGLTYLLKRSDA
jgi:maltose alpha-D-glucosyltransferase / alpha-amylase